MANRVTRIQEAKVRNSAASEASAKLYLNEDFADVHFNCHDGDDDSMRKIPANKGVLAALSPVFNAMFFGALKEGNEVNIVDADAGTFKEFLQFFYLNEVKLSMENVDSVARMVDKYDIAKYVSVSAKFLKNQLTSSNMCWGYQLALTFNDKELIEFCGDQIGRSPKGIFASDTFKQCNLNTLQHILQLNLTCNEMDIFKACLVWAKSACIQNELDANQAANMKNQLGGSLKKIRFGEMMIEDLTEIISNNKELFTSDEFRDICSVILRKQDHRLTFFEQLPRRYIWNPDAVLKCTRTQQHTAEHKCIQLSEAVSFTSNQPVLLGQFLTQPMLKPSNAQSGVGVSLNNRNTNRALTVQQSLQYPPTRDHGSFGVYGNSVHSNIGCSEYDEKVNVTIYEIGSQFDFRQKRRLFQSSTCSKFIETAIGRQLQIDLPGPILIKPHIIYEINLTLSKRSSYYYYTSHMPIEKMQNDLKIRFHQNADLSHNDWVKTLCFNKL